VGGTGSGLCPEIGLILAVLNIRVLVPECYSTEHYSFLYVEIKCQLDAKDEFLLQILLLVVVVVLESCVSGLRAASRKPDTQPSAPHHTDNLKTKAPNTTGINHLYNTLEVLMMGIMVPETC
jgi:hypothetical protein